MEPPFHQILKFDGEGKPNKCSLGLVERKYNSLGQ